MKNSYSILLCSSLLVVLLAGCASAPKFAAMGSLPPDRPVVYFYGPTNGTFITCRIDYNGKRLTSLHPGEYFAHQPKPGTNSYTLPPAGGGGLVGFMLDEPSAGKIRVGLLPGKVYYFKGIGINSLLRVDETTGSGEIAECRLANPINVPAEELPPSPVSAR